MFNKNKKNNKGFTLVELLVVIAIIGILAVVAVPALMKNVEKSKVASLESDINAIKSAALSYYTENNEYPTAGVISGDATGKSNQIENFEALLEAPLSNKFKGTYETTGSAPDSYTLTVTIPGGGLSETAKEKLESDLSIKATTSGTITNGFTVTLIKGSN